MKDNIFLVVIFLSGVVVGRIDIFQNVFVSFSYATCLLYALMFVVGISIGNDVKTLRSFRKLSSRVILLPFLTIFGTLFGGLIASLIIQVDAISSMAISAGLGYYSLSSIILSENVGVAIGTIALLSNIFRELIAILLSPILARYFSPFAPIAAGGATTMDVTLPFVLRTSGAEYLVPSVYHGFVCDLSVPMVVSFLASLL
mgnify:CR=1 FL=1